MPKRFEQSVKSISDQKDQNAESMIHIRYPRQGEIGIWAKTQIQSCNNYNLFENSGTSRKMMLQDLFFKLWG